MITFLMFDLRGCGEIGRHARFRFWYESVQVQVLSSAPNFKGVSKNEAPFVFFSSEERRPAWACRLNYG